MKRRFLFILIFVLSAGCVFCQPSSAENNVEEYYKKAGECIKDNDWPRAVEYLRRIQDLGDDTKEVRGKLAVCYNNWGMQFEQKGELDYAIEKVRQALSYDAQNPAIKSNLANLMLKKAQAQYKEGYEELSLGTAKEVVGLDPKNAYAYILLGDLYYKQDDFKNAASSWNKAAQIQPSLAGLGERMEKLKREESVESKFRDKWGLYFKIRFEDNQENDRIAYRVLDKLSQAYRDIGHEFEYYPDVPTTVIIYTSRQFGEATGKPLSTLGVYDGKIRLRISDVSNDDGELGRLLYHEYAHAVVSQLYPKNIPVWLHEGIAGWLEAPRGRLAASEKKLLRSKAPVNFYELDSAFSSAASPEDLSFCYLESRLFVQYFVERYNRYYLKELLSELYEGKNLQEAVDILLHIDIGRLNSDFLSYLKKLL